MTSVPTYTIDPRIEVYGRAGRTAALADLIEFRSTKHLSMSSAELADLVVDNGWSSKPLRQIVMADDGEDDTPDSLADQVFALIAQRSEVLGDQYPFEIVLGRPSVKDSFDLKKSPYFALLAITIAHAWKVPCSVRPEAALEYIVRAALHRPSSGKRPWLSAFGMGTAERSGRSFTEALSEGAAVLGLSADPNPTPVSASVQDAGVDVLYSLGWQDGRPGNWVFIGQATCGMTETWGSKLTQPKPGNWRGYLQELLSPRRFLTVPHHVDDRFIFMMHTADDGLVLDRLRLTLALDDVPANVAPVVDAVLASKA